MRLDLEERQELVDQLTMLPGEQHAATRPGPRLEGLDHGAILMASGRVPITQTMVFWGARPIKPASRAGGVSTVTMPPITQARKSAARRNAPFEPAAAPARARALGSSSSRDLHSASSRAFDTSEGMIAGDDSRRTGRERRASGQDGAGREGAARS